MLNRKKKFKKIILWILCLSLLIPFIVKFKLQSVDSRKSDIEIEAKHNVDARNKEYCTVTIRCNTILDNIKDLREGLEKYVPEDGEILEPVKIELKEGDRAFDIIKRATRIYNIQMEFRDDPMYSGAYIEGINHLYEYDCGSGSGSGWMYKVNGWFPNYGCSQYKMKDGDEMVWCYTCNIGRDVGDQYYDE